MSQLPQGFIKSNPISKAPIGALCVYCLILRAKALTAEHDELQKTLNDSFDAVKAKRAGELRRVATALEDWETANSAIAELRAMTQEPADQDDADLAAIARDELDAEVAKLQGLERNLSASLTPRHPFADLPCMLEIRPGPGGLEGRYFADTVFKMYRGLCARKGYRNKVVKYDLAEGAGDQSSAEGELPLQEAILEIEDAGAAVAVWVLPSFAEAAADDAVDFENPESDFYIDPQEVKIETMRARGAGGQHVNKTESAIRMTHLPTGTTVSMQDHRSQHRNRDEAWKLMRSRIAAQRAEKREEEAARLRNSVLSTTQITRGDKIRTYNYNQDRCTDHRAGLDVHNLPSVLEGSDVLDKIMDAARESLVGKEIEMLVAEEEAKAKAAASGGKK
ncbi:hypothetical protein MY5147_000954 [Beauveria neobassiana]